MGLKKKQKLMIESMKKQLGIVTAACKESGISRQTHYRWLEESPEYKEEIDRIPELVVDFAENALFKLIQEKNPTAIIFFLKTKAKHRGYIEKSEIEHKSTEGIKFVLERQDERVSPEVKS
jgi:hypothetical protein